jgi:hypothetical protein
MLMVKANGGFSTPTHVFLVDGQLHGNIGVALHIVRESSLQRLLALREYCRDVTTDGLSRYTAKQLAAKNANGDMISYKIAKAKAMDTLIADAEAWWKEKQMTIDNCES